MTPELRKERAKITKLLINNKLRDKVYDISSIDKCLIEAICPKRVTDVRYWKECVRYFLHCILSKTLIERYKPNTKFVALNFDQLKIVLGNETSIVIKTLIDKGIVVRDNKSRKGSYSYGYKIKPNLLKKGKYSYRTLTHPKILKRLSSYQKGYLLEQKKFLLDYDHTVRWLLNPNLMFDKNNADKFIEFVETGLRTYFSIYHKQQTKTQLKSVTYDISQWVSAIKLANGLSTTLSVSKKGLRLNTAITGMYSHLRNFLSYNNEEFVYVDICNSQPFHFLAFLHSSFWERPKHGRKDELCLYNLNRELYDHLTTHHQQEVSHTIMTLKLYENDRSTGYNGSKYGLQRGSGKKQSFPKLVMNGKLYMFIASYVSSNQLNMFLNDGCIREAKKGFIRMFYSDNRVKVGGGNSYYNAFKKHFPFEANIIKLLKQRSYKDFSILLQQIEAKLVIGTVCKQLYVVDKSMPIYTIHDGILTTKNYEQVLKNKLNEVYEEKFGIAPETKTETLSPSILDFETYNKIVRDKAYEICMKHGITWVVPVPPNNTQLQINYECYYNQFKIKSNNTNAIDMCNLIDIVSPHWLWK